MHIPCTRICIQIPTPFVFLLLAKKYVYVPVYIGASYEMAIGFLLLLLVNALCVGVLARNTGLPWSWDTLGSMRYSFCGNSSGPLNDAAVEVSS